MVEKEINNTKIVATVKTGNGLVATHDISPGSVIINIPKPYMILLEKEQLQHRCSRCFLTPGTPPCTSLKSCTACKVVRYCSGACQKADWTAIHKKECGLLQKMPGVPPTATRGLMQLSLLHRHSHTLDPRLDCLVHHMDEVRRLQKGRFDGIMLQATGAAKYTGRGDFWLPKFARVLCQMSMNGFQVTEPDGVPIGLCFEPTLSIANHSCTPNALVMFNGPTVLLRALTEIKEGEEIFISYINTLQSRAQRQEELTRTFFFTCECTRCNLRENEYETYLRLYPTLPTESRRINVLIESETVKHRANRAIYNIKNPPGSPTWKRALPDSPASNGLHTGTVHSSKDALAPWKLGLPALPPSPKHIHDLYLHYLDRKAWIPAIICLLNVVLHCDPYNYPESHYAPRVVRLFVLAQLLSGTMAGMALEDMKASLSTGGMVTLDGVEKIGSALQGLDVLGAWQVLVGIVLEEVERSHGKESRFAKEVYLATKPEAVPADMINTPRATLERWVRVDSSYEEGSKEALKAVHGLESLAACLDCVLDLDMYGRELDHWT